LLIYIALLYYIILDLIFGGLFFFYFKSQNFIKDNNNFHTQMTYYDSDKKSYNRDPFGDVTRYNTSSRAPY